MSDLRIEAIRNDPTIGRATCSVIDECWTDKEVIEELDHPHRGLEGYSAILEPEAAVAHMRWLHDLFEERYQEINSEVF